MIELIKFLLSAENYKQYGQYVPKSEDSTLNSLFDCLKDMHSVMGTDLSFEEYRLFCLGSLPSISKKDKDSLLVATSLLDRASRVEISDAAAVALMDTLRERQKAFQLAATALDYSEGRGNKETLLGLFNDFQTTKGIDDEFELVTDDIGMLYNETVHSKGLVPRLNCLATSLGPLRKGNFGFLFARPEVGKTTFLCSESSHMFSQLEPDQTLLWINNEEVSAKVKMRWAQSYFGVTREEFLRDLPKYRRLYAEQVGGRFIMPADSTKDKHAIERLIESVKPGLIIIDALDAIEGFKADREDLRLGAIFTWARELAKEHCPIIGVTWADGSAEGVKWLNMGHVINAKTEKQKPADWILGIGQSHEAGLQSVRHLQLSKNKLDGSADTDESLRHGRFDVLINPTIARFEDI